MPEAKPKEIPYRHEEKAMEPIRASKGAAGWDLYTTEDAVLYPYRAIIVPTGIKAALPNGTALLILPRSGYSIKNQIVMPNSVGLIDEDYRGTIGVSMMWTPDITSVSVVDIPKNPFDWKLKWNEGGDFYERPLRWSADAIFKIPKFTRIAQALLIPYLEQAWRKVDALPETERGDGGFGHTGTGAPDAGPGRRPAVP